MGLQVTRMTGLFVINSFGWWWRGDRTLPAGPSY